MSQLRAASIFLGKGQRPGQEDFAVADRSKGIFIVADGFGGPIPGALAAKSACEAVRGFLFKQAGDLEATLPFVLRTYFSLAGNVLFNALIYANQKLNSLNLNKGVNERGGASVVAGFIDGNLLALANVGTCSAWMLRSGRAVELVVPRNFGYMVDPFSVDGADEFSAPLIALGMTEDLEPEVFEYRIQPGDWILLHSDGILTEVRQQILQIQQIQLEPDQAIQKAMRLLNNISYIDNAAISLIIV